MACSTVVSLKQRREAGTDFLSVTTEASVYEAQLQPCSPGGTRLRAGIGEMAEAVSNGHQCALSHTGERHLYWTSSAFAVEWSGKEPQQGAGNLPEAMLGSLWGNRGAGPDQGCWCEWAQKPPHGRSATFWSYTTYSVNLEAIPSSWKQMSSRF